MAKRILVADDSVTIQKAFAMTFTGDDEVVVTAARSADEGLTIAQKMQPDLVIADGAMPGRSGYDLCASLRGDPNLRGVPVYILASTQQPYDEARGQRAGVDGHLTKPWETTALIDRVHEALRGGAGAAPSAATPADGGHFGPPPTPPPRISAPGASSMSSSLEDDYGEISIDQDKEVARDTDRRARLATPPPPPAPPPRASMSMPAVSSPPGAGLGSPGSGLRPSLIPGMRPGAMPTARPGTAPVRPVSGPGAVPSVPPSQAPLGPSPLPGNVPPRPAAAPVGRTMIGLPAANVPIPGAMRPSIPSMPSVPSVPAGMPPAAPAVPGRSPSSPGIPLGRASIPSAPVRPTPPSFPSPIAPPHAAPAPSVSPAAVSASVDQKLAAFAAKGPEYEAIAKLSREIIEQVVWEVVPELAEAIIREHVAKRGI
jgi:CheY-like chemotaxis protein